jgi:hypothetical protein
MGGARSGKGGACAGLVVLDLGVDYAVVVCGGVGDERDDGESEHRVGGVTQVDDPLVPAPMRRCAVGALLVRMRCRRCSKGRRRRLPRCAGLGSVCRIDDGRVGFCELLCMGSLGEV